LNLTKTTRVIARAAGSAILLVALGAGTAAAHQITVDPNGNGDGIDPRNN